MATGTSELSATLIQMADTLVSDYDLLDYLDRLLERSMDVLDAAAGGVMLADGAAGLQLMVATDERMRTVELFELQREQGPCIDSYRIAEQVVEEDLTTCSRWPQFTPVAVRSGYRSVFTLPMRLRGEVLGALNLFRVTPGPAPSMDFQVAQSFADMATIGILQERAVREARTLAAQLQSALNSRVVIEQAKGIIAERAELDMGQAYQVLRAHARHQRRRLGELAEAIVTGGLTVDDVTGPP